MTTGLLLAILAGLMCGSLMLLTHHAGHRTDKKSRVMRSTLALVVVPWTIALLTVPHVGLVYARAGVLALAVALGLGALWGAALLIFARSNQCFGMSLVFPATGGPAAAAGALVPLLLLHPARINTLGAWVLIAGVVLLLGGAANLIWSDRQLRGEELLRALAVCAGCGTLAASLNLGLALSRPITATAERIGSTPAASINAVLPLILGGAFVVDLLYLFAFSDGNRPVPPLSHAERRLAFSISAVFGLLAGVTLAMYAAATTALGDFGTIAGWPILVCVVEVSTHLCALVRQEQLRERWQYRIAGVASFTAAGGVLSYAVSLLDHGL